MKNSTALVLLLISVGLFFTFISPHYDKMSALMVQTNDYKDILQNIEELKKKRDNLTVEYKNFPQSGLDKLNKVLPESVDTVSLALNLDSIAGQYGISIKGVHVTNTTDPSGSIDVGSGKAYEPAEVSFSFDATYDNFKKFMTDLERNLRISDVKRITFSPSETGPYTFSVDIITYWLKTDQS